MTTAPSIWRRMAPEPVVLEVLRHFGIPERSVESVSPLVSGGARDRSVRVRATDGEWVLKRYGPAGRQRLQDAHELETRLLREGFPVAPLRRAGHGGTLVRTDDAVWSVHAWVPGRHLSVSERDGAAAGHPELIDHLGAMVGTLHRISNRRETEEPGRPALGVGAGDTTMRDPDRLLRAPVHAVRRLRRPRLRPPGLSPVQGLRLRPRKNDFDRWILRALPEIAQDARRLSLRTFSGVGPMDVGLVHHDLNWENIVLDDELRLRALLDFDNATRAPWVLEVGSAAVVLVGTDPDRLERFLASYRTASGIRVDPGLVRLAMELKCVQSILNSMVIYLDGDTDTTLRGPWCRDLLSSLRDLRERDVV